MNKKLLPIALPVRLGTASGYHPNVIYDAEETGFASLSSVNQNGTLEAARADEHCAAGLARADYMIRAANAFLPLIQALLAAQEALEYSEPIPALYPNPPARHDKAHSAINAALAAAGIGEPKDKRWGWSVGTNGSLCTSAGTFDLVADHPANQGNAEALARYIADAITLLHQLGGAGL